MTTEEIMRRASEIAGACWDDRERIGTLYDQLHYAASTPAVGSDDDLTDDDRAELIALADTYRRQSDAAMDRFPS